MSIFYGNSEYGESSQMHASTFNPTSTAPQNYVLGTGRSAFSGPARTRHHALSESNVVSLPKVNSTADFKNCPVCGAVCFADMDICFGCLHHFSQSGEVIQNYPEAGRQNFAPDVPCNMNAKNNETITERFFLNKDGAQFEVTIGVKML